MNEDFINCWNEILVPKWNGFRHLLSGNGGIHSEIAYPYFGFRVGDKVLDIGCGYSETCLDIGRRVTDTVEVLGLDCTEAFLADANRERDQAGLRHVRYELGGAQTHAPPPGDQAKTCGPGPFSMADEETDRAMLKVAGFTQVESFRRVDAEICVGTSVDEAIDYQILVGPSGEIVREAGEDGQERLPSIRAELRTLMEAHRRTDGSVWIPSSTWAIMARKS